MLSQVVAESGRCGGPEIYGVSEDAGWPARRADWFPLAPTCACLVFRCKCTVTPFFLLLAEQTVQLNCCPLATSTGSSHAVVTTHSSAVFTCGCGYACWHVFPQRKTTSKARAYSPGNIASEGREINDHFSPKWLISPNLQFCRNVFKSESRQLKKSTFVPAGYINA